MQNIIAPSILSVDFGHLSKAIGMIESSRADWIHVDVMDGVFVPNISFGFPIMEVLNREAQKPLDVHLMIVNPEKYIEQFAALGAAVITVHYEVCTHLDRVIQQIKNVGCKAGVAINPHTSVSLLENIWHEVDLVLAMSVNPGFGGQKFIQNVVNKVKDLQEIKKHENVDFLIEVDGGVNLETGKILLESGANVLVAGSAIFNTEDPSETIQRFKQL